MAISKDFIPLFSEFVMTYKLNGMPKSYYWTKELNHQTISKYIDELHDIITQNKDAFHDSSIIESLSSTVLLSARTNPYLLECWIEFLTKYNSVTQVYAPIGEYHIKVGLVGAPSEKMIEELRTALTSMIKTAQLTEQAHRTETDILKRQKVGAIETSTEKMLGDLQAAFGAMIKTAELTEQTHWSETTLLKQQIEELNSENLRLSRQNNQLQLKIQDQNRLEALQPQIDTAQKQLSSLQELLSCLQETTKSTSNTQELKQENIPIANKTIHQSPKIQDLTSKITPPTPSQLPSTEISDKKAGERTKTTPTLNTSLNVPPPPPPPPIKTMPTTSNSSFFNDINSARSKLKPIKSITLTPEKKNSPVPLSTSHSLKN